jgi:FkbM family methyltransferase
MREVGVGYRLVRGKLAILTGLEQAAAAARRIGLGAVVDRVAPLVGRPFERFALDVDGVLLAGTDLAHLHYVRELREQGREQTFVRLLADAVPPGGTVLEGGAHLGFVTVHAARAVGPTGRVLVFEPNEEVLEVLQENLTANGVAERVEIHPAALGEREGRSQFYASGETSSLIEAVDGARRVEVDVVRGDDAAEGSVDVIKLDIEGGELAALRGMERLVAGARTIFLELNPELLERAGASRGELLGWLAERGFEIEWIDEEKRRTAPLPEPSAEAYVNIVARRTA